MHFWGRAPGRAASVDVVAGQRLGRGREGRVRTRTGKSVLAVFVVFGMLVADIAAAGADWIMPVEAPVVDSFRPSTTLYGAGNRGLEFGESEGLAVVAVDAGRVTFAGRIGSHRYVVVDHGQGLRSTYAYLATISVVRGQAVSQGTAIGVAASGFHLTARLGEVYVDPALLVAGAEVVVQLTESELPTSPARATNSISASGGSGIVGWFTDTAGAVVSGTGQAIVSGAAHVVDGAGQVVEHVVDGAGQVIDGVEYVAGGALWVADRIEAAAVEVAHRVVAGIEWTIETAANLAVGAYHLAQKLVALGIRALPDLLTDPVRAVKEWHHEECTDLTGGQTPSQAQALSEADGEMLGERNSLSAPDEAAGSGHILVQVAGLGSNDGDASIGELDAEALGYETSDIVGFSYGGGCIPQPFDRGEPQPGSLTDQLSNPENENGAAGDASSDASANDVGSSSYGAGDTMQDLHLSAERLADLLEATAAERPGQPIDIAAHSLGGVVTRLALEKLEARRDAGTLQVGAMPNVVITIGSPHSGVDQGFGTLTPSWMPTSPAEILLKPIWSQLGSIGQISNGSQTELAPPGDLPEGVTVISVAGESDVIVPAVVAIWDEATNVLVLGDLQGSAMHSNLPSHPDVASELELALRGLPPRCVGLVDLLSAAVLGTAISQTEKQLASLFGF